MVKPKRAFINRQQIIDQKRIQFEQSKLSKQFTCEAIEVLDANDVIKRLMEL